MLPGEPIPADWNRFVGDGTIEIVRGDIADADAVRRAVRGSSGESAKTIFHLAAVVGDWGPEALFQRVTVEGTGHLLRAAAVEGPGDGAGPGARVVLASSIVVYGDRLRRGPCPESTPHGRALGPYSRAKQAQERLARRLAGELGVDLTVVRPANVYGPGSRPWVEMVLPLLRARQVTLIDGGDHSAGLCHVENLVDLLLLAAQEDTAIGRIYNASDLAPEAAPVTWRRYFGDLARIIDAPPPRSVPYGLARPLASACESTWRLLRRSERPPLTREALNLAAADHRIPTVRARDDLGWTPRVGYDAALAEIADSLAGKRPL